jgi:acetate kinase
VRPVVAASSSPVSASAGAGSTPCTASRDAPGHRTARSSLRAQIAAMAAALGGLDVLVFSGGIGENAAGLR